MVDVDRLSGNVLISDANNNRVRTIDLQSADLVIHTSAGVTGLIGNNGAAGAAYFNQISGLFAAPSGLYYLADPGNNQIYQVDEQSGQISVIAGNSFSGYNGNNLRALDANLNGPSYAQPDPFSSHPSSPANLLISDTNNNCIRLLNYSSPSEPVLSSLVGMCGSNGGYNGENTLPSATLLNAPTATAINPSTGDIVIVGSLNYCLRLYSRSSSGLGATFDFTGQSLYFTDVTNSYIWRMDLGTGFVFIAAGNGVTGYSGDGGLATDASLSAPYSISFDKKNNLYLSGSVSLVYGPSAWDNVFIVDSDGCRVWCVNVSSPSNPGPSIAKTIAGTGQPGFSGDGGLATLATLSYPSGVAWRFFSQASQTVLMFIADTSNNAIRLVNLETGLITLYAGNSDGKPGSSGDGGLSTAAYLNGPVGLALDSTGNLYIADSFNALIRMVNAQSMVISTVAGHVSTGNSYYFYNSNPPDNNTPQNALSATLNLPSGLAFDSEDNLYIADTSNNCIRLDNPEALSFSPTGALYIADS
eukprot:gene34343-biopygen9878